MEGVLKTALRMPTMLRERDRKRADVVQRQALVAEIREVCDLLHYAQHRFDQISDPDLVDACIYEMEALRARYRFLLGQAKKMGLREQPFALCIG